jgi:hypothetical protein
MVKKISRTLQEFLQSTYMLATGCRKRKLDDPVFQSESRQNDGNSNVANM